MNRGGDGLARHGQLLVTGWWLGSMLIAVFVGVLAFGARRSGKGNRFDPTRWATFLVGGLLFEATFSMMCLAYQKSLYEPDVRFLGPFPTGLSWLLFGIWLVPGFFVVTYVVVFHRWIFPPSSAEEFGKLAAEAAKNRQSH